MGDQRDERTLADYNKSSMQDVQTTIAWGNLAVNNFELSAPQIRLIIDTVRFHGMPNESPHRHLAKFMHVSMNLKINGVPQEEIRLRLFPYTLSGKAEAWLDSLPPGSITTWDQMTERFLGKYFPPERTARCREDVLSFKQHGTETLYESWERFKELLSRCPHHGIPIIQLMDKFYNGLDGGSRRTLDLASNGGFDVMRAADAWDFLEKMSMKSQNWEMGREAPSKSVQFKEPLVHKSGVHRIDEFSNVTAQMEALTRQVAKLQANAANPQMQHHEQPAPCELCGGGHYTSECPQMEQVDFVGQYRNSNQQYGNTYNPNWRNHPNFSWRSNGQTNDPYPPRNQQPSSSNAPPQKQFHAINPNPRGMPNQHSGDNRVEKRVAENEGNIRNIQASLQNLEAQMGQIAKLLMERQPGTLPGHTEPNPKEHLKPAPQ